MIHVGLFLLPLLVEPAEGSRDEVRNLTVFAQGVLADLDGRSAEACGFYETAFAGDPDSFQLARRVSAAQLREKDLATASRTLRTFAAAHRGHLASQLYFADFLEQNGGPDDEANRAAEEILSTANARFPHRPEIFTRLINAHENQGNRSRSLQVLEAQLQVTEAGPDHWMALAPIARTLLPAGSEELRTHLDTIARQAVATGVELAPVARYASDYYRQSGRLKEATAVLVNHVAAVPDSLGLRTRLGLLQLRGGRDDEGLRTLREVLAIDPDFSYAHRCLAQYFRRHEAPTQALLHHAAVLRLEGGGAAEFRDVADQYLELGQPHKARLLLEKARFEHPEDALLAARLAVATQRDGAPRAAARLFRQAESLAQDSPEPQGRDAFGADFQLEFAHCLQEAGDPAAAAVRLREAIRGIPPEEPRKASRALRALAALWLAQGTNRSPAISLLKRAEALDPGNPETATLLEEAQQP